MEVRKQKRGCMPADRFLPTAFSSKKVLTEDSTLLQLVEKTCGRHASAAFFFRVTSFCMSNGGVPLLQHKRFRNKLDRDYIASGLCLDIWFVRVDKYGRELDRFYGAAELDAVQVWGKGADL